MKKILVVDDDTDILTLVKIILTKNEFAVEAISRWEDIENRLVSFKPDLILLDVSLIGADGRDICREIKSRKETQHIPVVLFSAHAELGNNFRECDAEDFIAKPFEISHLVRKINLYLN